MSQTKAIVNKLLTGVSKGYLPEGFIGDQILTDKAVVMKSGLIGSHGKQHLRLMNTVYGGRGKAPRFESNTRSSTTYLIESHGLEGMVTQDDYDNVEDPFDAEKDETLFLTTVLKISREKAIADALGSTSVLTQNVTLSGTSQFNDYVNSNPLSRFEVAQAAVYDGCGVPPDSAIMSWKVFNKLSYHPAILEALGFKENRAGTLNAAEVASAMKVKRLLVGQPKYNSAALGQTDVLADIWGKNIVFAVLPREAMKMQVSLGYQIRKIGQAPYETSKWDHDNPRGATGILTTDFYDDVLTDVGAAYLIKDAIA